MIAQVGRVRTEFHSSRANYPRGGLNISTRSNSAGSHGADIYPTCDSGIAFSTEDMPQQSRAASVAIKMLTSHITALAIATGCLTVAAGHIVFGDPHTALAFIMVAIAGASVAFALKNGN